jgi:cytochrome P450
MIDTSTATTGPDPANVPGYPMPRGRCPFDPPPGLRELQAKAPITRVRIWNGSTPWLISRHDDVRALLKDPRVSAATDHPNYPYSAPSMFMQNLGFLTMDDPEHSRQRRLVTKPFTIKRVEAMRPTIQKIVDDLIDAMLAGPKPVDLVSALAFPVPGRVICELLGVPYADDDYLLNCVNTMVDPESTGEASKAARQELVGYLERLVTHKRADPADDLLSELATEHVATLSRHEAAMLGLLLVIAGHETTANMIALGTLALLEHPDQLAVLRATEDPRLIAGAVEELLRYLSIPQGGRRRVALEDIEIGGVLIRAGEGLIIAGDLANRDESVFADPDRLDVRRNARRQAAFGFGPHQCLGQPLARVELQIVYPTLFRRIPTLRRAADLDQIPFKQPGESIYGVFELPVTW